MNTSKRNITDFTNSDHNSEEEKTFLTENMNAYYNEKLKKNYSEILKEKFQVAPGNKPNFSQKASLITNRKWIYLIVGSILSILVISFLLFEKFNKNKAENEIQIQYASFLDSKIEMEGASRGEITDINQSLLLMAEAYEKGSYQEVVDLSSALEPDAQLTIESKIQIAFAEGIQGNVEKSASMFENLLIESSASMQQEIRWTLLNLYVENKEIIKAERIFSQMQQDDYKYTESKRLLNK